MPIEIRNNPELLREIRRGLAKQHVDVQGLAKKMEEAAAASAVVKD